MRFGLSVHTQSHTYTHADVHACMYDTHKMNGAVFDSPACNASAERQTSCLLNRLYLLSDI